MIEAHLWRGTRVSPTFTSVTFGPTALTTPDASSPMIAGNSGTGSPLRIS
jgi:hypothetical protein